jgi:hypothetical protein
MDFWSWKIWTNLLFVPLYACIIVYELYVGYIIGTQYMIYIFKNNICVKELLEKN